MTTPGQVASSTRERTELLDSAQWAQSLTGEQVKRLALMLLGVLGLAAIIKATFALLIG